MFRLDRRTRPEKRGLTDSLRGRVTVRAAVVAVGAALTIGAAAMLASAGSCRVLVALGSMDVQPTPSGLVLRLSGTWEFDNLLQVQTGLSFNVLVIQGDHFLRFTYPDHVESGDSVGLSDALDRGLEGSDLLAVEAAGTSNQMGKFVSFEPSRMKLALPTPVDSGPLSAVAYLVIDGDYISPIISNTLSLSIKDILPVPDSTGTRDKLPVTTTGAEAGR